LEVHGKVQLEIAEKLLELSKDYDDSAHGRTEFWKAAKPIYGDLDRKRRKKLMRHAKKIRDRVDKARSGIFGSLKRVYNQINRVWMEHASSKAMRQFGGGRKWYFQAHENYLRRWHELERRRGHAIDRTDLKNEWIDQFIHDVKMLEAFRDKFTEQENRCGHDAAKVADFRDR